MGNNPWSSVHINMGINHGLCRVQRRIYPSYFRSSIVCTFSSLVLPFSNIQRGPSPLRTLRCARTHSAGIELPKSSGNLRANSQWDNKRPCVRIQGVPGRTGPTLLHRPLLLRFTLPASSLPKLRPLHANLTKAQPALSEMLVYQVLPPPPPKSGKVITAAILFVCISVSVSLSQLSPTPNTPTHSFLFFPPSFSTFFQSEVKWASVLHCQMRWWGMGGGKELRALPKCQIYNSALLGHVASGHVSASLLTLFAPKPLSLLHGEKIHLNLCETLWFWNSAQVYMSVLSRAAS